MPLDSKITVILQVYECQQIQLIKQVVKITKFIT